MFHLRRIPVLPFSASWPNARDTLKNGKVIWIEDTGVHAANHPKVLENPIDFLFIDGDHSYSGLSGDWEAWSPLIAIGGLVALHDSRSTPQRMIDDAGSVRFTNEVIVQDSRFRIVETVDSLTVVKRVV